MEIIPTISAYQYNQDAVSDKKRYVWILLVLIIALGFFLRVYNINNTPPGVYPDEAVNGIDAMTANDTGNYQWFYPANQGREGLFMNLIALLFKLFGVSVLTLKLPAIIFGTLTILGTFLLAKELYNYRVGLISSFLVAVSFWPVNFNRISFRANMLPFVLVFTFYFLFRGLREKKMVYYAIGGFIFGLGLHTYIAFRITPLILIALLVSLILSREHFLKYHWKPIVVFILFSFISAAPMLYTFLYSHPEYLESRSASVSILSPEVNHGQPLQTFLRSFTLSLVKYNFWGDQNWRHNYPPYPILDTLTGIAFLFGFIYCLMHLIRTSIDRLLKKIRNPRMDISLFLLAWFFVMLIPEFMTAEGLPHALRAIGTYPAVFIFSGIAFEYFWKKSEAHSFIFKRIIASLIILMLISIGIFNSVKYHYFWAGKIDTARSFEKVTRDISRYIDTLPRDKEVFLLAGNMQRVPVRLFAWNRPGFHDLHPAELDKVIPENKNNFTVIFTDMEKENILRTLQNRFPQLKFQEFHDEFGIKFYVLQ